MRSGCYGQPDAWRSRRDNRSTGRTAMAQDLTATLTQLLQPIVEASGLFLEGVETTKAGKYSTVRVVIDLADGPGSLDLDTIATATQAISDALDDADPIKGQYTLEVTSPGAERELTTPRHFRRALTQQVEIATAEATLTGELIQADDELLVVETADGPVELTPAAVVSARSLVVL